jgi:DNA-binding NarL/FixJ family response regulator
MKKILIFEDNKKYLASLRLVIDESDDFEVIAAYPDASNVCDKIHKHNPDVILMDIEMPGLDGIQSVALLRKEFKNVKVLMLTILKERTQVMSAIQAGVNGYLVKSWPAETILEEISFICETGEPVLSPEIAKVLFNLAKEQSNNNIEPRHFDLSPREKTCLCHLTKGHNYYEIAAELYISQSTVNTHLKSVYKKLEVHSAVEAIHIANTYKICDITEKN